MVSVDQKSDAVAAIHEVNEEIKLVGYGYVHIVGKLTGAMDSAVLAPSQPDAKIEVGRAGLVVDIRL